MPKRDQTESWKVEVFRADALACNDNSLPNQTMRQLGCRQVFS